MSADHENEAVPNVMNYFAELGATGTDPADPDGGTKSDLENGGRVTERLRHDIGDAAWRNWIKPLRVSRLQDGTLTLEAGSSLARDRVSSQYADRLRVISAAEYGSVKQVEVKVAAPTIIDNKGKDSDRPAADADGYKSASWNSQS